MYFVCFWIAQYVMTIICFADFLWYWLYLIISTALHPTEDLILGEYKSRFGCFSLKLSEQKERFINQMTFKLILDIAETNLNSEKFESLKSNSVENLKNYNLKNSKNNGKLGQRRSSL
jgi:hypothetical protein